ncbi:hypothetical protein [Tersicoccus phoenicis]|nr:hypothetical protein [Tersicoccus phoenicis]
MEWTDDVSRGAWIGERTRWGSTVTGTVPAGYPMYARVFHPVPVSWVATDPEQIAAMPVPPERPDELRDAPRYTEEQWTWARAAEALGTTMHATARIGSAIDVDSTLVGGTREAISAVARSAAVEALVVRPDDDLSAFADHVDG